MIVRAARWALCNRRKRAGSAPAQVVSDPPAGQLASRCAAAAAAPRAIAAGVALLRAGWRALASLLLAPLLLASLLLAPLLRCLVCAAAAAFFRH